MITAFACADMTEVGGFYVNCAEGIRRDSETCGECGANQGKLPGGAYKDRGEIEKYCENCRELTYRQAEICPQCGVKLGSQEQVPNAENSRTILQQLANLREDRENS